MARAHACATAWDYVFPEPEAVSSSRSCAKRRGSTGDEGLDALLSAATGVRDQDERLRACREFERIWIGEHAAVVPLVYHDRILWRRPWVTGMWANGFARSTFAEAVVDPELRSRRERG